MANEERAEWRIPAQILLLHETGQRDEFDAAVAELTAQIGEDFPGVIGLIHGWAGNHDAAFRWLDGLPPHLVYTPPVIGFIELKPMKEDPRWPEFRASVGLSEARVNAFVAPPPPSGDD